MSNEERARISRENGAKSKGPKTAAGKEQSKRNAIKHGERAEALKLLVPPHSACLLHEDRLAFYRLFDRNLAKYHATDDHEKELVREMTSLQWSNGRNRLALNALLNREIIRTGATLQPLDESTFNIDNVVAAYESVAASPSIKLFHREYAANVRLIATLERRMIQVRKHWPAEAPEPANSNEERRKFGLPEAAREAPKAAAPQEATNEGTPPPPTENTENTRKKRKKVVNVTAPLTPEKIRLYQQVFPNRDLEFNVYEPEPKAA